MLKDIEKTQGLHTDIIVVAQSLGAHVISNYIWDAYDAWRNGRTGPRAGIWHGDDKKPTNNKEDNFLRFRTLQALFTTGANIPLFISGLPKEQIFWFGEYWYRSVFMELFVDIGS